MTKNEGGFPPPILVKKDHKNTFLVFPPKSFWMTEVPRPFMLPGNFCCQSFSVSISNGMFCSFSPSFNSPTDSLETFPLPAI